MSLVYFGGNGDLFQLMCALGNAEPSSKKLAPTLRLNNGYEMPAIGLGTFQATSDEAERAIKDAIDAGYRHIDTAFLYGNEVDVGNAVRAKINEGIIKREDMFITTKVSKVPGYHRFMMFLRIFKIHQILCRPK